MILISRISGPVEATSSPIQPRSPGLKARFQLCRPGCGGGRHPEAPSLAISRGFAMEVGGAFKRLRPAIAEINTQKVIKPYCSPLTRPAAARSIVRNLPGSSALSARVLRRARRTSRRRPTTPRRRLTAPNQDYSSGGEAELRPRRRQRQPLRSATRRRLGGYGNRRLYRVRITRRRVHDDPASGRPRTVGPLWCSSMKEIFRAGSSRTSST